MLRLDVERPLLVDQVVLDCIVHVIRCHHIAVSKALAGFAVQGPPVRRHANKGMAVWAFFGRVILIDPDDQVAQ